MKALLLIPVLALASCAPFAQIVPFYDVDLRGVSAKEIELDPIQRVEARQVSPVFDFRIPSKFGGGAVSVPISVTPGK